MENVNESATHSAEVTNAPTPPQVDETDELSNVFETFGLTPPELEKKTHPEEQSEVAETPPIESSEPEKKGMKVKFLHEEVFVEEERYPELLRKGLNHDRIEGKISEYQKALDEVAKLQGFKDHNDLMQNLEKLKEDAKKREEDQFRQLREDLRQQAEDAGLDPEKVEQFIENHPLMKEARRIKAENEERAKIEQQLRQQQEIERQWTELYQAFPELIEDAKAWTRGETPSFYTPEMQALVERGYHPLHAYKLAHMDKLTTQAKELARQAAIKEQMLNKRSQVETDTGGDMEPEAPEELKEAFALFGLDPKLAKKYAKR